MIVVWMCVLCNWGWPDTLVIGNRKVCSKQPKLGRIEEFWQFLVFKILFYSKYYLIIECLFFYYSEVSLQGLVDCYLAMHRSREAVTIASNACKLMGQTPRALTVCNADIYISIQ